MTEKRVPMQVAVVAEWLQRRRWIAGRLVMHPVEGGEVVAESLARDLLNRIDAAPDADAGRVDGERAIQDALRALYKADIDESDKRKIEQHLINADAWTLALRTKLERRIERALSALRSLPPALPVREARAILQGDADV